MIHRIRNILVPVKSLIKDIPIFGCLMLLMAGFLIGFIMPNYDLSELSTDASAIIFIYFGASLGFLGGLFISSSIKKDGHPDKQDSDRKNLFLNKNTLLLHHFIPFIYLMIGIAVTFITYMWLIVDWSFIHSSFNFRTFTEENPFFSYLTPLSLALITLTGLLHRSVVSDAQFQQTISAENIRNFNDGVKNLREQIEETNKNMDKVELSPNLTTPEIFRRMFPNSINGEYEIDKSVLYETCARLDELSFDDYPRFNKEDLLEKLNKSPEFYSHISELVIITNTLSISMINYKPFYKSYDEYIEKTILGKIEQYKHIAFNKIGLTFKTNKSTENYRDAMKTIFEIINITNSIFSTPLTSKKDIEKLNKHASMARNRVKNHYKTLRDNELVLQTPEVLNAVTNQLKKNGAEFQITNYGLSLLRHVKNTTSTS